MPLSSASLQPMELGLPLLGAAAVGALGSLALARSWRRHRLRARQQRGRRGELRALRLLERAGFRVTSEQVEASYALWVDGQAHAVTVRADAVVERRGRCYVVEVKTGGGASATDRHTRRQLLEYGHAFDCDGLILADMERETLQRVDFHPPHARSRSITAALVLACIAAALGTWLFLAGR